MMSGSYQQDSYPMPHGAPMMMPQNPPQQTYQSPNPPSVHPQSNVQSTGPVLDMKNTLWMGDLEAWMDENWLRQLWYSFGETVQVKMIRDKFTGMPAGYCFVTFASHPAAMKTLTSFNGSPIPNTHKFFKLNWASGGSISKGERTPEYSIFVGDLAPEVSDYLLLSTFQQRYPSCKSAKVVADANTHMSRGYGFVRFGDESEQQRALSEMNGQFIGSRQIRVSLATPKNKGMGGFASGHSSMNGMNFQTQPFVDPNQNSTTVFVGGLNSNVTEDELRTFFQPFGDIINVKIPPNKGCGFVQYTTRQSAEVAIQQMNGAQIGTSKVRLSWGRSQNDRRNVLSHHIGITGYRPPFHQFPYGANPGLPFPPQHVMQPRPYIQHPNPSLDVSKHNGVNGFANVDNREWKNKPQELSV